MKRNEILTILLSITVLLCLVSPSFAQRGMGENFGVAQQGLKTDTVTIQGEVVRVITGPCEKTTGWSEIGSHFMLKTEQGDEWNIHLGPAQMVQEVTDMLSTGANVTLQVFRTEKMPEKNYVAITVTVDNKTMRLREENLRPVWAGQPDSRRYQSDTVGIEGRVGRGSSLQKRLSRTYGCPQNEVYYRQFCSAERIGRGRSRGQGWGQSWQSSQSRRGFAMRRRAYKGN